MDGGNHALVFIVARANDIGGQRTELIRRFGEVLFVGLLQPNERREIPSIDPHERRCDPRDSDLGIVVRARQDFTGGEVEKVIQDGLRRTFADEEQAVAAKDLLKVARETVPLVEMMAEGITHMHERSQACPPGR